MGTMPMQGLLVPAGLAIEGDYLVWQVAVEVDGVRLPARPPPNKGERVSPHGTLRAFKQIHDAAGVLRFARRYGPLGWGQSPAGAGRLREPVQLWLDVAETARAIYEIASQLQAGRRPTVEALEHLYGMHLRQLSAERALARGRWRTSSRIPRLPRSLREDAAWLAGKAKPLRSLPLMQLALNRWMETADMRPGSVLRWRSGRPEIEVQLTGRGVLGVLGVQLLLAMANAEELQTCDGCARLYAPKRKPAAGRRAFCSRPECKQKAALLRQRDRRQRQRRA